MARDDYIYKNGWYRHKKTGRVTSLPPDKYNTNKYSAWDIFESLYLPVAIVFFIFCFILIGYYGRIEKNQVIELKQSVENLQNDVDSLKGQK